MAPPRALGRCYSGRLARAVPSGEAALEMREAIGRKRVLALRQGRQIDTARAISLIFGVNASITTGPGN